jgi:hypothetical protein
VEDALALIGRGRAPGNEGRFVLDQRGGVFSNPENFNANRKHTSKWTSCQLVLLNHNYLK